MTQVAQSIREEAQGSEGRVSGSARAPILPRPAALYVATTLDFWVAKDGHHYAPDVGIYGVAYRRLDPEYFAWLKTRVDIANRAAKAGQIGEGQLADLTAKFGAIETWAIEQFGEEALHAANQPANTKRYVPPSMDALERLLSPGTNDPFAAPPRVAAQERPCGTPAEPPEYQGHVYPTEGTWRALRPVGEEAIAKVDAIRDQAISLGWSPAQLYQNRGNLTFPCGQDYGLVCHLGSGERLGEITRPSIEIVGPPPRETITRFYNWEVEQPWMKRTSKSQ